MNFGSLPLHNPNKIYFVGDIHGDFLRLKSLWEKIEKELKEEDHVVFLGDLVNRLGLYSAEVLEFLFQLKQNRPSQVFFIEGNHDWMLKNFLETGSNMWMKQYGQNTIQSFVRKYQLEPNHDEIRDHLDSIGIWSFLNSFLPYYETEKVIATHAPLNRVNLLMNGLDDYVESLKQNQAPARALLDKVLYDIKWGFCAEEEKLNHYIPKFLVCGHQFKHHKRPRIFKDRVFVDVGCGAVEGKPLAAFIFPSKQVILSD